MVSVLLLQHRIVVATLLARNGWWLFRRLVLSLARLNAVSLTNISPLLALHRNRRLPTLSRIRLMWLLDWKCLPSPCLLCRPPSLIRVNVLFPLGPMRLIPIVVYRLLLRLSMKLGPTLPLPTPGTGRFRAGSGGVRRCVGGVGITWCFDA